MKGIVSALVLAASVVMAAITPAQATSETDPVAALKAQFTTGNGVRIATSIRMTFPDDRPAESRQAGVIKFDPRGQAASDITENVHYSKRFLDLYPEKLREQLLADNSPTRMITVGRVGYASSAGFAGDLPHGKKWVRYVPVDQAPWGTVMDILETPTLEAIMKGVTTDRAGVLRGSIKTQQLATVSPSFREQYGAVEVSAGKGADRVTYALWLDSRGLVKRLTTDVTLPFQSDFIKVSTDSTFTRWGARVSVSAPPEKLVVDHEDVRKKVTGQPLGILK
ncbi:hypothetical protein ACOZ38_25355 [Sphaerisporangium viridialbum]|uniref:hypothetical protein n=1 Tax=Sphaerisporangium viridialbum TaxID=46189 RepID=UPI003C77A510